MIVLSNISLSNISVNELVIAIVGYVIVFLALASLYLLFRSVPKILYLNFRRGMQKEGKEIKDHNELIQSGEETAAIAMALHLLFDEMHDEESGILTIKKVSKTYSPWSSKIYAVRNQFNRI